MNVAKFKGSTMNNKTKALAQYLMTEENITAREAIEAISDGYDENNFDTDYGEYLVVTDDEAYEECKECIEQSLWVFNSWFLSNHSEVSEEVFKKLSELYEDSNDAIKSLIIDFDEFVENAISADGRGHFMNSYDGNEYEEKVGDTWYYIYRTN